MPNLETLVIQRFQTQLDSAAGKTAVGFNPDRGCFVLVRKITRILPLQLLALVVRVGKTNVGLVRKRKIVPMVKSLIRGSLLPRRAPKLWGDSYPWFCRSLLFQVFPALPGASCWLSGGEYPC